MSRLPVPIASLVAGSAFVIGFLATAISLPIDDFWLTLRSGGAIAHGADPSRAIGLTWIPVLPDALNPQWGAQVVLGAPGWLPWALLVNAALIGSGILLTLERARSRGSPAAVAVAMLLALATLAPHLLARAQSFSIALAPLAFLLLERFRGRAWLPLAYGLLVAAWANLHGAFVVGQVAAGASLVAALVRRDEHRLLAGLTLVAALAAPLLNPVGPALIGYAYGQPASDLIRMISVEWQPSWPWVPVATSFWILVALLVAGRAVRRGGARLEELLLLAGLGVLGASSIRHIPWFVVAAVPLLTSDIDSALHSRQRLRRALGAPAAMLGGRSVRRVIVLAAALALAIQPARPGMPQGLGRLTPDAPVGLADRLEGELPATGSTRILNEQTWGGYLAYRFGGRIETAMDGRIEIRSRATWEAYFDLMHGERDPAGDLAANGVRWAVIGLDRQELQMALEDAGWEVVARDEQGLLLRAPRS